MSIGLPPRIRERTVSMVLELFTPEGIGTMIAVAAPGEEGTP